MKKQKMLYLSPFWPIKSGISEYSEILIQGLKNYFDITLLTGDYQVTSKNIIESFSIVTSPNIEEINFENYDVLIYNFGNNPAAHDYMYNVFLKHPGYIILHDLSLYYLTIGHYQQCGGLYSKIYELEGTDGIIKIKESLKYNTDIDLIQHKQLASQVLLNKEILSLAKGIFVHSNYTKKQVMRLFSKSNVYIINLVHCMPKWEKNSDYSLQKQFNIQNDELIVGSVGFIGPSKQCELGCMAVQKYNQNHTKKMHYVMVGEGNCVDHLLGKYIHKTGFLNNNAFFGAISQCDLILNLRNPYHGESSATLLQCMMLAKACIVTNIGWFGELPAKVVYRVSKEINSEELEALLNIFLVKENREEIQKNALAFANEYGSADYVARQIWNCLVRSN